MNFLRSVERHVPGFDASQDVHLLLALLILSILFLLLLATLLLLQTLGMRFRHTIRGRRLSRWEAAWRPDILAAICGSQSIATPRLSGERLQHYLTYLRHFEQRVRGAAQQRAVALGAALTPELRPLLEHRSTDVRARAARLLGDYGGAEAEDALAACLDDPAPLVAIFAMQALSQSRNPERVRHMLGQLDRFENWSTSYLVSLCRNIDESMVPALREILADRQRTTHARVIAAESLRELHDTRAASLAVTLLAEPTEDPELIAALLRLVGDLGRKGERKGLLPFCDHESSFIRIHAVEAVARSGDASQTNALQHALQDDNPWVAARAARGLLRRGLQSSLIEQLHHNPRHPELLQEILSKAPAS